VSGLVITCKGRHSLFEPILQWVPRSTVCCKSDCFYSLCIDGTSPCNSLVNSSCSQSCATGSQPDLLQLSHLLIGISREMYNVRHTLLELHHSFNYSCQQTDRQTDVATHIVDANKQDDAQNKHQNTRQQLNVDQWYDACTHNTHACVNDSSDCTLVSILKMTRHTAKQHHRNQ